MTDHKVFNDLANIALATFKDKPTSLTEANKKHLYYFGLPQMVIVSLVSGNANQGDSQLTAQLLGSIAI